MLQQPAPLRSSASSAGRPTSTAFVCRNRRRSLTLAVTTALAGSAAAAGLFYPSPAPAFAVAELAQNQSPSATLANAGQLLEQGEYEQALQTLEQVQPEQLPAAERSIYEQRLEFASTAVIARRAARESFAAGQAAMEQGNLLEAAQAFSDAAGNNYADAGTVAKAREQLELVKVKLGQESGDLGELFESAKADIQAGRTTEARRKLQTLVALDYSGPTFGSGPQDYLRQLDAGQVPVAGADLQPGQAEIPTTQQQNTAEARNAYLQGLQAYRQERWDEARQFLVRAREAGYQPMLFEDDVDTLIGRIDRRVAAARDLGQNGGQALAMQEAPPVNGGLSQAEQIRQAQQQAQAAELARQAESAMEQGNRIQAISLYNQAVQLDPGNEQYQQRVAELEGAAGLTDQQQSLIQQVREAQRAERQLIQYQFENALEAARGAAQANDFAGARAALERARAARNANPIIFTNAELEGFDRQLAQLSQQINTAQANYEATQADILRRQALEQEQRELELQARQVQQTIASLIDTVRRLNEQQQYTEALATVDQILTIDPRNDFAIATRPIIQTTASLQQQRRFVEEYGRQREDTFTQAMEAKIPYTDILRYPENWPSLSDRRERTVAEERGTDAEDATLLAQLDRGINVPINFESVPFEDVIEFLRNITGASIFVNYRALENEGISRTQEVSLQLAPGVPLRRVLQIILDDLGGGLINLGYTVEDGVITISTEEDLARNVVTQVFDIRDLIVSIPDFEDYPDFELGQNSGGGGSGGGGGFGGGGNNGGGGGGGGGLFGGNNSGGGEEEEEGPTREELVEQIINLIVNTVASETWKPNGGTIGSIDELGGQLIVTQTPEIQRQVAQLLSKLRETRAIQVNVEARFLTVQRNFLEDVGVDFDFVFNFESPPTEEGEEGFGPIAVGQNSLEFTDPATLSTGLPGSLGGGALANSLSTTVTAFLDNFQAQLFLRATQVRQDVQSLTAPRLTLFNGQRAYVVVATQQAYVSDLEPVVGDGAVGFDPEIATVESGVILAVQATVSADRKYVTLTLQPSLSRLIAIRSFTTFGGTADPGAGDDGGDGTDDGGDGQVLSFSGRIQQPEIEITQVRTTVSVPDRGTLLLGGQTLSGTVEREAGVPVLSKVPFLKRLFTNRSVSQDEQVLLILVKPTIIIQREVEQDTFPLLAPAGTE